MDKFTVIKLNESFESICIIELELFSSGTPQDFLESVVEQDPRPRLKRKILTQQEINNIKEVTPDLKHGTNSMFRSLRDKGIISYTEYLFLLSVLTSE